MQEGVSERKKEASPFLVAVASCKLQINAKFQSFAESGVVAQKRVKRGYSSSSSSI
ncbi:hypothetical protein RchiOBHm_Chr4g0446991 [Rosa chinensis]|uniref:Uncharacterized protein n=1 Tax=Rosa chinensis TaxID=74649 RepID=A0A2P6R4T1_ROSCH|nr:hypothetical protein RchiOBHm_Chr4g0446991 [Rosa chinensis]